MFREKETTLTRAHPSTVSFCRRELLTPELQMCRERQRRKPNAATYGLKRQIDKADVL